MPYTIQAGDHLKFDVFIDESSVSTYPFVALFDGATYSGGADQNGLRMTSQRPDLSGYALGKWYSADVLLSASAGNVASYFCIGERKSEQSTGVTGVFTFYYANVRITSSTGSLQRSFFTGHESVTGAPNIANNVTAYSATIKTLPYQQIATGGTGAGTNVATDDGTFKTIAGAGGLLAANNLSDVVSASTSLTNLGGTTLGSKIFTLTNPSAVTFIRINADNSVTARSQANMQTDLALVPGTNRFRPTRLILRRSRQYRSTLLGQGSWPKARRPSAPPTSG